MICVLKNVIWLIFFLWMFNLFGLEFEVGGVGGWVGRNVIFRFDCFLCIYEWLAGVKIVVLVTNVVMVVML